MIIGSILAMAGPKVDSNQYLNLDEEQEKYVRVVKLTDRDGLVYAALMEELWDTLCGGWLPFTAGKEVEGAA